MRRDIESIIERIDEAWDVCSRRMDWSGLEGVLRDILEAVRTKDIDKPEYALYLIDEAIAAFTKRGNTLPPPEERQRGLFR